MSPGRRRLLAPAFAALLAAPAVAGVPGMLEVGANSSPVRTQPLAANEVLFEAGGVGFVTTRADLATITVTVSSHGTSMAEARRANQAEVARVVAAARRAGVPADAIETGQGRPLLIAMAMADAAAQTVNVARTGEQAHSVVTIRLRDLDRAPEVRAALQAAGTNAVSDPLYSLTDQSRARHLAQAQALAAARADAEAHASRRNMRVARLVRVTERIGTDIFALAFNNAALFRNFGPPPNPDRQTQPDILTFLMLGADYALAPR
jgi:uncharacterized protein YggE